MAEPVVIIGAGPAGLMAAEVISAAGLPVALYDSMPGAGRKLLRAGRGGLNLTHSEPLADFLSRYGPRQAAVARWLADFGPQALRDWAESLGIETFVGSSGRVFPRTMKAAPLLRAWLQRLRAQGVTFHLRHRWLGWTDSGALRFATPTGDIKVGAGSTAAAPGAPIATVLALGGGSWARLGSDAAWVPLLNARGIDVAPLRPANCGFDIAWSAPLRDRFAGQPVKSVTARIGTTRRNGEFLVTQQGVEGSLIYALAAPLRDTIERDGQARLHLDLVPGRSLERLVRDLAQPRGHDSLANHLRRRAGIEGIKAALLYEVTTPAQRADPAQLAARLKDLPLILSAPRPLDEAISSAGGVRFEALNDDLMLHQLPGTFCAGEMLDWEAPTGGYLLTACLASGRIAGQGVVRATLADHRATPSLPSNTP
jgi:uncharacterized flavoprotein (TIGR03862 family)